MDFFRQISIFLLLGQTILHFAPGEKYEKYIKLLLGFMVIAQFVVPILSFGNKDKAAAYENDRELFTKKMDEVLQTVDEKWFQYNEQIEQQIERELEDARTIVWEQEQENEEDDQEEKIEVEAVKIEVKAHE